MSRDYFEELPPELILLVAPFLPTASLNALVLTCLRLREILQPELEMRITQDIDFARSILLWAADSRPHIVKKLVSPPHSLHPSPTNRPGRPSQNPLFIAVTAGNMEIARLLLDAGANPALGDSPRDEKDPRPVHMAAQNKDLEMMKLLLDRGAPVNDKCGHGAYDETALHQACWFGDLEMVKLLLDGGADIERLGHYGGALGFAVASRKLEVVKFLLAKGADATVTIPLFVPVRAGDPPPHHASLLYDAMGLWPPSEQSRWVRHNTPDRWEGLPLGDEKRELMALLLAHGASKDTAMATITNHLSALANEAHYTEQEYVEVIWEMLKQAEDAIPEVMRKLKESM
ncbi:ankyrin repeat-containing domain protein [Mycena galopus ATCC 62051]|nr:ankyrin repeat-containing domain protein [Mycena galopus ATCC 62051]